MGRRGKYTISSALALKEKGKFDSTEWEGMGKRRVCF